MWYKQLDGVRAFAVLLVLWAHFFSEYHDHWLRQVPFGAIGVDIFFFLSGFLLTGKMVDDMSRQGVRISRVWVRFFLARAFRIFPLYYLVLSVSALTLLVVGEDGRWFFERWEYYVFYLVNWCAIDWSERKFLAHLWSLSIEEQFYLFWPALIFGVAIVSRKNIMVILCVVFLAVELSAIYAIAFYDMQGEQVFFWVGFTERSFMSQFFKLGYGGLWALFVRIPHFSLDAWVSTVRRWNIPLVRWGSVVVPSVVVTGYFLASGLYGNIPWTGSLMNSHLEDIAGGVLWPGMFVLVFLNLLVMPWLVIAPAAGCHGLLGRTLEHPISTWIAERSYGIYVIHYITGWTLSYGYLDQLYTWLPGPIQMGLYFGLPMFLADMSYRFVEMPVRDAGRAWMNRRFPLV